MVDVVLRPYTPTDLEAMFALDEACFAPAFRFSRRAMRKFAEARKARVAMAVAGDVLAGFLIVHVERTGSERVGYVVTLDVAEEFRRRGVARQLLEAGARDCRAAGCAALVLHVFTGNEAAIAFYEREQFVAVRRAANFYGAGLNAVEYRRGLGESGGVSTAS